LPFTVAKYAEKVPTVCLCGTVVPDPELYNGGFDAVFSIINAPSTLDESMTNTEPLLENAAYNVAGMLAALLKL
ncbi:MAG: glycerate kinase, partial [Clostridia bacterium]|nr:glycerate kinase [Clostridia bacterium]